jgi:hypothetical protein
VKTQLLAFLMELERAIPPPPKCHHALTAAQFGSNIAGWEDKLALQMNIGGEFVAFFLDDTDLLMTPEELVRNIVDLLYTAQQAPQLGIALGQLQR